MIVGMLCPFPRFVWEWKGMGPSSKQLLEALNIWNNSKLGKQSGERNERVVEKLS